MNYFSACSGIACDTLAAPKDWHCAGYSEIWDFPRAVLDYHYPNTPNFGDINDHKNWDIPADTDLFVGGTPCQSFSVAGKKKGMDDERGQLTTRYFEMVTQRKPRWFVWENVPHALHHALPQVLEQVTKGGYSVAWRVLDSLSFGVPQRRRRLFLVGHHRDWRRSAAVLYQEGSSTRTPQARQKGEYPAKIGQSPYTVHQKNLVPNQTDAINPIIFTPHGNDNRIDQKEYAGTITKQAGTGGGNVPMLDDSKLTTVFCPNGTTNHGKQNGGIVEREYTGALDCKGGQGGAARLIYANQRYGTKKQAEHATTLLAKEPDTSQSDIILDELGIRYLTPEECEALQGIPKGYTDIPWRGRQIGNCPVTHRYQAIGNSICVPVLSWIFDRIAFIDSIPELS